ncbi:MAG: C-type lectin domain-containing protein, partial [Xanthomonadales bacterium]|nr:C-type lectin domain-containing protein [Xanthomonadales bacterium]
MNFIKATFAVLLLAWALPLAAQPVECADNGHFFELVPGGVDWATAEAGAAAMTRNGVSGYLATIASAAENACVKAASGSSRAWLGGNDIDVEGTWVWVTGEPWSYTNWNTGEPNDSGGEDCLEMRGGTASNWNDIPCGFTAVGGYVVEFEPGVEISVTGTDNLGVDPVIAGSGADNIDFTFAVLNDPAYDDATGVDISASLQFSVDRNDLSCTILPAGFSVDTDTPTLLEVTWSALDIAAGDSVDVGVTCTAGSAATDGNVLTATVSLDAVDQPDDDAANDSDDLSVTIESAAGQTSTFATSIVFTNGATGSVTAELSCNAGLPLEQSADISDGSPVNFTMTDLPFTDPGTTCEIMVTDIDGYTIEASANGGTAADSCMYVAPFDGTAANTCVFTATPNESEFAVEIDFDSIEDPAIDLDWKLNVVCTPAADAADDTTFLPGVTWNVSGSGSYMNTFTFFAEPDDGTDCTATLSGLSSAIEEDGPCTIKGIVVGEADDLSTKEDETPTCTITATA